MTTTHPEHDDQPKVKKPKKPQDHQSKKNHQKDEADGAPIEFDWDGEHWTVPRENATGLEFMGHLTDAQDAEEEGKMADAGQAMIRAVWALLGRKDGNRLLKGRQPEALGEFFDALGEAAGSGNQ